MTEQQIRAIVREELGKLVEFSQGLSGQTLKVSKDTKLTRYKNFASFLLECVSVTVLLVLVIRLLIKLSF